MNLYVRRHTSRDVFIMARSLPNDEIEQIREFGFDGPIEGLVQVAEAFNGPAWAICRMVDDAICAVGGFNLIRKGVYQTWFMPAAGVFERHGADLTEICAKTLGTMMEGGAHRIETVSLSNRVQAHRWYERIGLTREAEHPGYGVTGRAAVTYVRVR